MQLSKKKKQAIADGFKATLEFNSIASKLDPKKMFSVEPLSADKVLELHKNKTSKRIKSRK
jgi:hypothetical protein